LRDCRCCHGRGTRDADARDLDKISAFHVVYPL
jgi:hypothetical protein